MLKLQHLQNFSLLRKPILVFFISLFIATPFYGQNSIKKANFSIEGRISHFGNGLLVGTITDYKNNTIILDTIFVISDVFKHKGYINAKQIVRYVVTDDRFAKYRKVVKDGDSVLVDFADKKLKSIEIVASSGANIQVRGTATAYLSAYPFGNTENVKIAALNQKIYPLLDSLGNIDYSNKKTIRIALENEEKLVDSITEIENNFIKSNPSSIISSYIVLQRFQTLNKDNSSEADNLLNLLKPQKSDIYFQYMLLLQQMRIKKNAEISVGDKFPDFQTKFIYKDSLFNLSQTQGKYRLIDFWGTWCIPCVKEMPKLKQFYEKYKGELVLISIANDNYQRWKTFLDKNTYTWVQLLDQEPIKLSEKLNVEIYPTKYLLDPSGKIIMIIKDSDEEVWSKIESMMNIKS